MIIGKHWVSKGVRLNYLEIIQKTGDLVKSYVPEELNKAGINLRVNNGMPGNIFKYTKESKILYSDVQGLTVGLSSGDGNWLEFKFNKNWLYIIVSFADSHTEMFFSSEVPNLIKEFNFFEDYSIIILNKDVEGFVSGEISERKPASEEIKIALSGLLDSIIQVL